MSGNRNSFERLYKEEQRQLDEALDQDPDSPPPGLVVTKDGVPGEPWVKTPTADRVGLALSGGGIRSAIFNLGLLEALDQRKVLRLVDYLSTVSGGGYIGGFWTAWRKHTSDPQSEFPHCNSTDVGKKGAASSSVDDRERPETRHLREFSRFLIPRIGVNEPEMWFALAAILGGMLPALVVTIATVALIFYIWLGIGYVALYDLESGLSSALVFLAISLLMHWRRDANWQRTGREQPAEMNHAQWRILYWWGAVLTSILGAIFAGYLSRLHLPQQWGWDSASHGGESASQGYRRFITFAFEPALVWFSLALTLAIFWNILETVLRAVESWHGAPQVNLHELRLRRGTIRDQLTSRYLAWAVVAAAIAAVWEGSFWLAGAAEKTAVLNGKLAVGTLGGTFTGLYIWLRDWITKPDKQSTDKGLWQKFLLMSKPLIPMISATAGALLLVVFTVLLMHDYGLGTGDGAAGKAAFWHALGAAFIVLVALYTFDPAYFGLHDFYRARIARAFLGAAWGENDDRYTVERPQDDFCLRDLPASREDLKMKDSAANGPGEVAPDKEAAEDAVRRQLRPIHLICCTANHLTGDALSTLDRGARSAVLSQRGISLGDATCQPAEEDPPLTLSAAQTASAAAFNSQMGEKSLRLGPAGSFLMSAFNLRLGLWVRNPDYQQSLDAKIEKMEGTRDQLSGMKTSGTKAPTRMPIASFVRGPGAKQNRQLLKLDTHLEALKRPFIRLFLKPPGLVFFDELFGRSSALAKDLFPRLHLSDGGHFENLGLYELIRRHVRYIIVSDAGEDEEVAFDDLGNAIRRVREDFGVEIEIDLAPLRPNEKRESAQHIAVGTVHYDGFEGYDKGILLYLKPTLTGDESGDIQQYRRRNRVFPHEPTTDQFYAEAQWESYRRLGEHIGQVTFGFLENLTDGQMRAERVFRDGRAVWSVLPPEIRLGMREIAAKFDKFDAEFNKDAPVALRAQLWPELSDADGAKPAVRSKAAAKSAKSADFATGKARLTAEDEEKALLFLARAVQLFEEAWRTLRLGEFRLHPAHIGIMNRFERWWGTPILQRWWVPLSPLCSDDFREFIKSKFRLTARDPVSRKDDAGQPGPQLEFRKVKNPATAMAGLAWNLRRPGRAKITAKEMVFEYRLHLDGNHPPRCLQVGLAILQCRDGVATWIWTDFFVPDGLSGSGIRGRFLDHLLEELRTSSITKIEVTLNDPFPTKRDQVSRQLRLDLIQFYKSRGFMPKLNGAGGAGEIIVQRLLEKHSRE